MDPTSAAGDIASENPSRFPIAGSITPGEPYVQAGETSLPPAKHEANGPIVQTHNLTGENTSPDDTDVADTGQQAGTGKDEHQSSENVIDDNSIASADLFLERVEQPLSPHRALQDLDVEGYKRRGPKYARVAALYTEGLESRVGTLEKELMELQAKLSSEEITNDSEKSDDISRALNSPCAPPMPLKVMHTSLKDWKKVFVLGKGKDSKSAVILATATETSLLRPERLNVDDQILVHQNVDQASYKADSQRSEPSDAVRLSFNSPWPFILIELLSGEHISSSKTWISPFKHFLVFEEHIRKFAALLGEIDLDNVEAKNASHALSKITSEVVRTLGPKRDHVEISDAYVSTVLQKRPELGLHHLKVKKSLPEDKEEELGDDVEGVSGPSSTSPVADANLRDSEASALAPDGLPVPNQDRYMCTCLRDAKEHLQLLLQTLDSHLGSLMTLHKAIRDRAVSKIGFGELWHLFQPGDLVVTSRQPHQAYRVIHVSGGRPLLTTAEFVPRDEDAAPRPTSYRQSQVSPFRIECIRFDYDGEKFGPVQDTISIFEYEEARMVTRLDVYPMNYAANAEELRRSLLDRGQRFAEYHAFKHKKYEGLSLSEPQEEIESEVIIDFTQSYRQADNSKLKPLLGIQGAMRADIREAYDDICPSDEEPCERMSHNALVDDTDFDYRQMDRLLNNESHLSEIRSGSQTLTNDQLILMHYRVQGFSLRSRKWLPLNIELLQDIKEYDSLDGQNSGFEDLVIPDEYKKIVKALVKSHALGSRPAENSASGRRQIDLIRGKGKGLIILLHGVPGVGKTSTAESVASYTGRPLFPITCGDIGQTATDVERNLESIFHLARKWGCVLLLDEADVFLAKRERGGGGIDRNALVSVFLRTLEYYSGILFLTTNRIGSFDEAFKSRIHISLYYAPLSESQTFDVWSMNLRRLRQSTPDMYVDKSEIESFARKHWEQEKRWNGRQIRNAFQTAVALAEYEFQEQCQKCQKTGHNPPNMPVLEAKHFAAVAKTSAEFDDYLQRVMGGQTHEQKAQIQEIRSDTYDPNHGDETPSGKKHSYQRPVRPPRPSEQPPVRQSENIAKQMATPPATPQLSTTSSIGHEATSNDDEEYRQWVAEEERRKQAEKMERFRKRREGEQMEK